MREVFGTMSNKTMSRMYNVYAIREKVKVVGGFWNHSDHDIEEISRKKLDSFMMYVPTAPQGEN